MVRVISAVLIFIITTSCTIQSYQLDYLKKFFVERESQQKPEKNWALRIPWLNQVIELYAVNHEDQIIFLDENIRIFFKNNHIYNVLGILQHDEEIDIHKQDTNYLYNLNQIQIAEHSCEDSQIIKLDDGKQKIIQNCGVNDDQGGYMNQIVFNKNNLIEHIRFKIHPNYPMIELSHK